MNIHKSSINPSHFFVIMGVDLKVHDLRVDWTHLKGTQQLLLWNESASYIDPIDDHRTQKGPKTVPWIPELCETTNWGTNPIPIEIYICIYIYEIHPKRSPGFGSIDLGVHEDSWYRGMRLSDCLNTINMGCSKWGCDQHDIRYFRSDLYGS